MVGALWTTGFAGAVGFEAPVAGIDGLGGAGGLPVTCLSLFSGCAAFVSFAAASAFRFARYHFAPWTAAPATPTAAEPTFPIAFA